MDEWFDPQGVPGKLIMGLDGKLYFVPDDRTMAWDMAEQQDAVLFCAGGYENAVRVEIERGER